MRPHKELDADLIAIGLLPVVAWIVVMAAVVWLMFQPAHGSPACMALGEARKIWPTTHLWWHGKDHCWDNQSGRTYHAHRARAQAPEPPKPMPAPRAEELRPSLVVTNDKPMDSALFQTAPSTMWPKLLDVDEVTAEPADKCCWPSMEEISFAERWRAVPQTWALAQ